MNNFFVGIRECKAFYLGLRRLLEKVQVVFIYF